MVACFLGLFDITCDERSPRDWMLAARGCCLVPWPEGPKFFGGAADSPWLMPSCWSFSMSWNSSNSSSSCSSTLLCCAHGASYGAKPVVWDRERATCGSLVLLGPHCATMAAAAIAITKPSDVPKSPDVSGKHCKMWWAGWGVLSASYIADLRCSHGLFLPSGAYVSVEDVLSHQSVYQSRAVDGICFCRV